MRRTPKAAVIALLSVALIWMGWWALNGENPAAADQEEAAVSSIESNEQIGTASTNEAAVNPPAETNAAELETSAPIERAEVVGMLQLMGPNNKPVGGRVELVEVDESFNTHFSTLARIGQAIYFDSIVQEAQVEEADGTLQITSEGNRADFIIVFAAGFVPYLDEWESIAPGEQRTLILTPALPIAVSVLTSDRQPIQNANVWYRWTGVFNQNENAPLLERFRARFFQEMAVTDDQGDVVLTSTFPEWSTQIFVRPGDLWATVVKTVEAGEPVEILCPDAFMATGTVTVNGKVPEQEVQLKASIHQGDQYWMLESGRTKEEGRYKITGIPTGYPAYQIEAMGDGLANQTLDIFAPPKGSILHLDFAMEKGHGGSLLLQDAWGDPIQNGRIKFVAEGARSHMYGYNSDADGMVELPSSFRKGDSWWLNLRLGENLYLRLDQPFQVGESLQVTVPNLARITSLEIPAATLGDASLESVVWKGLSSQSWGTVSWNPEKGASTLLASGSASLEITFSDGRQFLQPIVLAPGFRGPVTVDRQAATLRFELPETPPAFISLANQNGVTVFGQDEVSGQVSIPLWQGRYALTVIWPETAREIPLIALDGADVDLGKIETTAAGFVDGIVRDSNGNLLQWANIYLTSTSGYSSQSFLTDAAGSFAFFDVPLGKYYLLCDTSQSHGSRSATVIETVTLAADRLKQSVVIEIPLGQENEVRLTCGNDWSFNAQAILATPAASSHAAVRSQGPTLLAAQPQRGWIGAAQILDGAIRAQAMPVSDGSGEYTLPTASMRTSNLSFVDEFGLPWRQLLMRLELIGHPVTRRPTLNSAGSLEVVANPGAPWSLQVCAPSGQIFSFELSALGSQETLVIPGNISGHVIAVQNESGSAIAWPILQSADGATVFPSDKNGRATIPLDYEKPLVVSAAGYLACWFPNPLLETIILPRRLEGIQVHVPKNTTFLRWTSDSSFDSAWSNKLNCAAELELVDLPPLDAANYSFSAFAADGVFLGSVHALVTAAEQVITLP